MTPTRAEKRAEALREVQMRRHVYPGQIARGRLTDAQAARQIAIMQAIADDYHERYLFSEDRG